MGTAISFREAVALAGHFPLLAGISLEIAEGEVVHLRGPNGAGKTSLLRACAGLVSITAGEAFVLGHDLRADRESVRRDVGMLGHATFLYDDLSAQENLRFVLRAARVPEDGLDRALARVGLTGRLASTGVAKLSAGQRRRVAIAVLIARHPTLWLLDEPHAGLDEGARAMLDELILEHQRDGGTTLIVSHELERASSVADRVLVVAGGQVHEPVGVHSRGAPLFNAFPPQPVAHDATEVDRGVA